MHTHTHYKCKKDSKIKYENKVGTKIDLSFSQICIQQTQTTSEVMNILLVKLQYVGTLGKRNEHIREEIGL